MAQVRPLSRDSRCLSRDSGFEEFDFLLPNGFMVTMSCDRRSSLSEVKTALWERAVQLPASNHLRDSRHYVFVGVNPSAVEEEYTDDQTIEEIQPYPCQDLPEK
ncbi:Phosphatidylinositol 4 [Mactra antiquata]